MANHRQVEFIPEPCRGVLWQCTDGKISGYGNTKQEALAGYSEAKQIGTTQTLPRLSHDGRRKYW